jgi:hypothetical protein
MVTMRSDKNERDALEGDILTIFSLDCFSIYRLDDCIDYEGLQYIGGGAKGET